MRDKWTRHDILFVNQHTDKLYENAYVSRILPEPDRSPAAAIEATISRPTPFIENKAIFALGIILIEVCLGQSFDQLRSVDDPLTEDGSADMYTDYFTADRIIKSQRILAEAGRRYESAVIRCIKSRFDTPSWDLENVSTGGS
jgi:hypothetical protein